MKDHLTTLWEAFCGQQLPLAQWTHEAHLAVAFSFLHRYPFYEALCLLRSGIISYNKATGTENTATRGYHETLTVFWAKVVYAYLQAQPNQALTESFEQFRQSSWADRSLALRYYSKERLFSVEARAIWTPPDLRPFDFEQPMNLL